MAPSERAKRPFVLLATLFDRSSRSIRQERGEIQGTRNKDRQTCRCASILYPWSWFRCRGRWFCRPELVLLPRGMVLLLPETARAQFHWQGILAASSHVSRRTIAASCGSAVAVGLSGVVDLAVATRSPECLRARALGRSILAASESRQPLHHCCKLRQRSRCWP